MIWTSNIEWAFGCKGIQPLCTNFIIEARERVAELLHKEERTIY